MEDVALEEKYSRQKGSSLDRFPSGSGLDPAVAVSNCGEVRYLDGYSTQVPLFVLERVACCGFPACLYLALLNV